MPIVRSRLIAVPTLLHQDTWQSLSTYPEPGWYKNAKFGISIHWGVYCVPAFGNEWYPRRMYLKDDPAYEHHINTYGPHKDFGYADFIPLFKADNYRSNDLAVLLPFDQHSHSLRCRRVRVGITRPLV